MRLTQGTFSYLPELSNEEVHAQLGYAVSRGWSIAVELTDDPHPRNVYWEMWGMPMFDIGDVALPAAEIARCREAFPNSYVRVSAYDASRGRQTTALSFIVHRPAVEPGFRLDRMEAPGRKLGYSLHAYAADRPRDSRYA